jgi:hypothetical protein
VLHARYDNDDMYTGIGPVLLAMNPYKQISKQGVSIYDASIAKYYYQHTSVEVAPHIFGIASEAYKRLTAYLENQCIIVTGESGAGKTEAAKQLMNFITHICHTDSSEATLKAHHKSLRRLASRRMESMRIPVAERVQRALGTTADGSRSRAASVDGDEPTSRSRVNSISSDGDITDVFGSIATGGTATFDGIRSLPQVEELVDAGRAPLDFVQELFNALGKKGVLTLDGFRRFINALEADLAYTAPLHTVSASLDFEQAYGAALNAENGYLSSPQASNPMKVTLVCLLHDSTVFGIEFSSSV